MAMPYPKRSDFRDAVIRCLAQTPQLSNAAIKKFMAKWADAHDVTPYSIDRFAADARRFLGIASMRGQPKGNRTAVVDWAVYSAACDEIGIRPGPGHDRLIYTVAPGASPPPSWPAQFTVVVGTDRIKVGVRRDHGFAQNGYSWRARDAQGGTVWCGRAHTPAEAREAVTAAMGLPGTETTDEVTDASGTATATQGDVPESIQARRTEFIDTLASLAWDGMEAHDIECITITPDGVEFEARVVTTVKGGIKRSKR